MIKLLVALFLTSISLFSAVDESTLTDQERAAVRAYVFERKLSRGTHVAEATDASQNVIQVLASDNLEVGAMFAIGQNELFMVISKTDKTVTVQRGYWGSLAKVHAKGSQIERLPWNTVQEALAVIKPEELARSVQRLNR